MALYRGLSLYQNIFMLVGKQRPCKPRMRKKSAPLHKRPWYFLKGTVFLGPFSLGAEYERGDQAKETLLLQLLTPHV